MRPATPATGPRDTPAPTAALAAAAPALWVAVALLALPDALLAPADLRGAAGAVYLAANVFVFFAALLLLASGAARLQRGHTYTALAPDAQSAAPVASARAELVHLFLHVMCLAYVRTACWFEWRALFRK